MLHREQTPEAYRREVVLHVGSATDLPVEYGAIEIDLDAFDGELREADSRGASAARRAAQSLRQSATAASRRPSSSSARMPSCSELFQLPEADEFLRPLQ